METGLNSGAKLEPLLLMAKSARGAAAAKLCADACAAPGVFVFGELLDLPSIQDLRTNEQHVSSLRLLELFAYGTYSDYLREKDNLPSLTPVQLTKLKQLSLVSLAEQRRVLPYTDLMTTLECTTIRALEDLIIDGVYAGVLQARLDQRAQRVEVEYTLGRDISPDKVGQLLASLQDWSRTTSSVLGTLDAKINTLRAEKATADELAAERQKVIDKRIKEINEKREKGLGKPGPKATRSSTMNVGDENDMDVDEEIGKGKGKKGSRDDSKGLFGSKLMKRGVNRF